MNWAMLWGFRMLPEGRSEIMMADTFGCDRYGENVCNLIAYDFEVFLGPYDPPTIAENERAWERARIEDEKWARMSSMEFYNFCNSNKWAHWRCF